MKTILTLLIAIALISTSCDEKKSAKKEPEKKGENWKERYSELYRNAIELGDANTAIMALHELIVRDTVKTHYYDSLAQLYFESWQPDAALLAAEKVLEKDPENDRLLEIAAEADQYMGNSTQAVNRFKKLYSRTGKPRYLYRIAADQFAREDFKAGKATVDSIMNHPQLDQDTIQLFYGQGQGQSVPMKAAVYNLQGYLQAREGKFATALKSYEQALKVAPDFVLAQRNIEELRKRR